MITTTLGASHDWELPLGWQRWHRPRSLSERHEMWSVSRPLQRSYSSTRENARQALCPPKPNEVLIARSMR